MKSIRARYGLLFAVLFGLLGIQCVPPVFAQDVPPPTTQEVDVAEVFRRGNMTVRIDGFMSDVDMAATSAYGPPADDSHKWFLTLIVDESVASKLLLAELVTKPELKAWASVDDPKKSWSHLNVYNATDKTQEFRWKNIKLTGYPTLLLQPPRNWDFGNPATVVLQRSGYAAGTSGKISQDLSQAILLYTKKLAQEGRLALHREDLPSGFTKPPARRRGGFEAGPASSPAEAPTGGFGQTPFAPPGPNSAPAFNPLDLLPQTVNINPPQPTTPQPAPSLLPLILQLVSGIASGQGFGNLLLTLLAIIQSYRTMLQRQSIKPAESSAKHIIVS